jgi:glycosyltransferase involved in cell wall biosynthesis
VRGREPVFREQPVLTPAMAPGDLPLVVIGIPTYNRCERLRRSIDSALAQTYPNVQVLVSDNASPDATETLCRDYMARDPRVRYWRQPVNVGATGNFNTVFAQADAPLFMWLADDDWVPPEFVARCVAALQDEPDVVLAGGRALYGETLSAPMGPPVDALSDSPMRRILHYYRDVYDNAVYYGVLRRECAARADVPNVMGGDWLYIAALAYQGKVRTVEGVWIHRERGGASSNQRQLAAFVGAPAWKGVVPLTFTLAFSAAADVLRNRGYATAPLWWRLALALLLPPWFVVFKPAQELRRRWQAWRARP